MLRREKCFLVALTNIFMYDRPKKKKKKVVSISYHDNQWQSLTHLLSLANPRQTCQGKQAGMPRATSSTYPRPAALGELRVTPMSSAHLRAAPSERQGAGDAC